MKQDLEADYLAAFKKTVAQHEGFLKRLASHNMLKWLPFNLMIPPFNTVSSGKISTCKFSLNMRRSWGWGGRMSKKRSQSFSELFRYGIVTKHFMQTWKLNFAEVKWGVVACKYPAWWRCLLWSRKGNVAFYSLLSYWHIRYWHIRHISRWG